jgi:sigma-B regulation protein RsbU (phosphoserine phosphatase)
LQPGDRLVLYTDGITEPADDSGDEFGMDRLAELFAGDATEPLETQYQNILQSVRHHANDKLTDDATLVLVSVADNTSAGNKANSTAF